MLEAQDFVSFSLIVSILDNLIFYKVKDKCHDTLKIDILNIKK